MAGWANNPEKQTCPLPGCSSPWPRTLSSYPAEPASQSGEENDIQLTCETWTMLSTSDSHALQVKYKILRHETNETPHFSWIDCRFMETLPFNQTWPEDSALVTSSCGNYGNNQTQKRAASFTICHPWKVAICYICSTKDTSREAVHRRYQNIGAERVEEWIWWSSSDSSDPRTVVSGALEHH